MKNLLFVFGIGLLLIGCTPTKDATSTAAEKMEDVTVSDRPRDRMERPELTDEQKAAREARRKEARKKYETMMASLSLTEEQRGKIDAINNKYQKQFRALRENNDGDREAMRETMMAMRERQQKELQMVMDEEQYATYKKYMEENRRGRRGGRPDGGRPERGGGGN